MLPTGTKQQELYVIAAANRASCPRSMMKSQSNRNNLSTQSRILLFCLHYSQNFNEITDDNSTKCLHSAALVLVRIRIWPFSLMWIWILFKLTNVSWKESIMDFRNEGTGTISDKGANFTRFRIRKLHSTLKTTTMKQSAFPVDIW
jgi:hypothetical protein